ncbi:pyridoxal-phosphate dependent enzyme [Parafrankia sp. FMc2]|uniref:pyridoxal-phosphate dependent enzyme n=1 Tax=Parafrankia sp. FMc2 TaxID=3233196 RepID=UPI0034D4C0E3
MLPDSAIGFPAGHGGPTSIWRYATMIVPDGDALDWRTLSLGEGMTPMVPVNPEIAGVVVLAKLDFLMPTLSFKDRGAAVVVAAASRLGASRLVIDSSGNAGTATAAYAARAGIPLDVFVPAWTSPGKTAQIEAYGAVCHRVDGDRKATEEAAIDAVANSGAFYASHVYNPLFVAGVKTFVFEMVEQLGGGVPDLVALPVGNGTMLLGAHRGFQQLRRSGALAEEPTFLAVQAERCAPVAAAVAAGDARLVPVVNEGTVADGIAIAAPARGNEILEVLRSRAGHVVTAAEDAIGKARVELARAGLFVEPTAAATYAGLLRWLDGSGAEWADQVRDARGRPPVVVLPLCGAGLKAVARKY